MNQPNLNLKSPQTREHDMVTPNYLRKLVDAAGTATSAGDRIGLTGGSVNTALRDNSCRRTVEIASRHIWEKDFAPKPGKLSDNLIICSIPGGKGGRHQRVYQISGRQALGH